MAASSEEEALKWSLENCPNNKSTDVWEILDGQLAYWQVVDAQFTFYD